jgi:glucokinase
VSGYAIGVDIGGTKIAAGLVSLADGKIVSRRQVATDRSDSGSGALAAAVELAADLARKAKAGGVEIAGIGVGAPELVDNFGVVRSRYNFAWMGEALATYFAPVVSGVPIVVESDVRAAARAEMRYGAGRGRRFCAYVTVGTGISYCLCLDGEPHRGANGYAIHPASSPLSMRCSECGSVQEPIVEEIASGPGLTRAYSERTGAPVAGAEAVLAAARAGDADALAVIEDGARLLGATLGMVINMLDPEAVVVGGGLGAAEGPYWPAIVAATRAHIFAEDCRDLPILRAALGADAGIVGAAVSAIS